ncbi:MAG: HAMP domain-containing histidine kinase [Deltaproteobacteria bacterium]|nr:HAMP domain-containing histidine kinase [Deltaproteobacteria bacterium]
MRRVLLLNALIFAVLAAAVALAYYGYSYTEVSSRERELALMQDLAKEKVLNIESLIDDADTKLMREVQLERLGELGELVRPTGAAVASVFVLDDKLELIPGGYYSNRPSKEGDELKKYFFSRILPELPLAKLPLGVRDHRFLREKSALGQPPGRWYLFSFMRRMSGDRTFYVVIEDDPIHLVGRVFPQFFAFPEKLRLYQVVDELGQLVFGSPFSEVEEDLVVEWPFSLTVDGWVLRGTQKDIPDDSALKRKKLVDSILIGGAMTVILAGLGFLAYAIRRERRLNELKSEFISNVSHELKTPLSIISMFGEMLAEGRTKSPEQAHEYAEIIWRESVRLGRLIDNVLDFAKMERGMGVYEFGESDIGEVVERAIELSNRRVQSAEMTLTTEIDPDLPLVELDANAFTLAVMNLIDNAIKYAADGKKIAVTLKREGDRLVLRVRDWGPGIDPEEHGRIFERFYRSRAVRLKPIRGSGIGLALVQHIAKAHGGEAEVESKVGEGATFRISIPIDGK